MVADPIYPFNTLKWWSNSSTLELNLFQTGVTFIGLYPLLKVLETIIKRFIAWFNIKPDLILFYDLGDEIRLNRTITDEDEILLLYADDIATTMNGRIFQRMKK